MMRLLIVDTDGKARLEQVKKIELSTLQHYCLGPIEMISPEYFQLDDSLSNGDEWAIYANEEGLLRKFATNRRFPQFCGPIVFSLIDVDGEEVGLSEEAVDQIKSWL
jgi:hypothetical protein